MVPGSSPKTRQEIEDDLLLRAESARLEYDRLKSIEDGTPAVDGHPIAAKAALLRYVEALRVFTDFTVHGKMPEN